MKLHILLALTVALFCLSSKTFAYYVWWDETVEKSDSVAGSYKASSNPQAQKYLVTLTIHGDNTNNISYGLFIPTGSAATGYLPAANQRVEGVNWWTLGTETGSQTITVSSDLGLWADISNDGKLYKSSTSSQQNWKTAAGTYEFHYQYNLNSPASATVTFTPVTDTPVGSPLPAPVVTLLIALGFGAALVMYRNRKQVKA